MSPERNGIQALEAGIIDQAREEASHILADAETKAASILQQARQQADIEGKAILRRVQDETRKTREHLIAAAQMEAQSLKLKRREQLLEHVFSEARGELVEVLKWPDYPQVVRRLLREAVEHLGADEVRARSDPVTQQILQDGALAEVEAALSVHIQLAEPLTRGIGLMVDTPDGHRRFDNTLETRLARMQDSLRTPVYHILMGEQQ